MYFMFARSQKVNNIYINLNIVSPCGIVALANSIFETSMPQAFTTDLIGGFAPCQLNQQLVQIHCHKHLQEILLSFELLEEIKFADATILAVKDS